MKVRLKTEKLARRQLLGRGSVQALHKARAPLKLENGVVLIKTFHFNKYATFMMTKLLSKKS